MSTSTVNLRAVVGGSSTANPNGYSQPHAGDVMQVMLTWYGGSIGASGTDVWEVGKTKTDGTTEVCQFNVARASLNQLGSSNTFNILIDISTEDDALSFVTGDNLYIKKDTNQFSATHVSAQVWVTYDD